MRTISIDGTASMMRSASSLSSSVGAPKLAPQRLGDGGDDARVAVAEEERAPRADEVEVAVAVEVVEVGALAPGDEQRVAADGAEGAGGAVDAAGDQARRALERLLAARTGDRHGTASNAGEGDGVMIVVGRRVVPGRIAWSGPSG
jgi:hypothetical protein